MTVRIQRNKWLCFGMAASMSLIVSANATGLPDRTTLYSTSAVNSLCERAQATVTASDLEVSNVIYSKWEGFVASDAGPFSVVGGDVPLAYSPPESPDEPLKSTQHLFYGANLLGNSDFPTVVSCKMKNAEYLNAVGLTQEAVDQPCKAVNAETLAGVMDSLTRLERWLVRTDPVLEDDVTADRGSDWTSEFPDSPYPVLYREYRGGPLHIKSSALLVSPHPDDVPAPPPFFNFIAFCNATGGDQGFLGSACEPRKWGVRYCHLPSPEYLRRALTGRVAVPTCGTSSADPRVCAGP